MAIFGGINFGDRFSSWRDFAIRLEGDAVVSELLSSLGWQQIPDSASLFIGDKTKGVVLDIHSSGIRLHIVPFGFNFIHICEGKKAVDGPWVVTARLDTSGHLESA